MYEHTKHPDLFDDASRTSSRPPPLGTRRPAVPPTLTFDDGSALPLDSYAERAYLAYAMSVVQGARPAAGRGRPEAGAAPHPASR